MTEYGFDNAGKALPGDGNADSDPISEIKLLFPRALPSAFPQIKYVPEHRILNGYDVSGLHPTFGDLNQQTMTSNRYFTNDGKKKRGSLFIGPRIESLDSFFPDTCCDPVQFQTGEISLTFRTTDLNCSNLQIQDGAVIYHSLTSNSHFIHQPAQTFIHSLVFMEDETAPAQVDFEIITLKGVSRTQKESSSLTFHDKDGHWLKCSLSLYSNGKEGLITEDSASLILSHHKGLQVITANIGPGKLQYPLLLVLTWSNSRSFVPNNHTATTLMDGRILFVGGTTANNADIYDPLIYEWTATGGTNQGRFSHTATLLHSGKVLIAGGISGYAGLTSAELFDPATGLWTYTGDLNVGRGNHTATLLSDGSVLVVGGDTNTSEIYDPATESWTLTDTASYWLTDHASALLEDGQVIYTINNASEIYNPATEMWGYLNSYACIAGEHTATTLPGGDILLVSPTGTCLYTLLSWTWTTTGDPSVSPGKHTATLLPNGTLLAAGGTNNIKEIYDPATETWSSTTIDCGSCIDHTATLLYDGSVLINDRHNIEINGSWTNVCMLNARGGSHPSILLPDGRVLFVAGAQAYTNYLTDIYDPVSDTCSDTTDPTTYFTGHTGTVLANGTVLVVGGDQNQPQIFDPVTETWSDTGTMSVPRKGHHAIYLANNTVLIIGGNASYPGSCEIYNASTGTWSPTSSMNHPRTNYTADYLWAQNKVLIAGGSDAYSSDFLSNAELYDPQTGTWTDTGNLSWPRCLHKSLSLPDGSVLVIGGSTSSWLTRSVERYDPDTGLWSEIGQINHYESLPYAVAQLSNGAVLVTSYSPQDAGTGNYDRYTEIYHPLTGIWTTVDVTTTAYRTSSVIVLGDGSVLLSGGTDYLYHTTFSGERFQMYDIPDSRRPVIDTVSQPIQFGTPFVVTSSKFRGDSETSGGRTNNSATNYPLVVLRHITESYRTILPYDDPVHFWDDPMTLTINDLPADLIQGWYRLEVVSSGVPSEPLFVRVACSIDNDPAYPEDFNADEGSTATFSTVTQGARYFQWQEFNGSTFDNIPGATASTFTTGTLGFGDDERQFRCVVSNDCTSVISRTATLLINDSIPPSVTVLMPTGDESWVYSENETERNKHIISWSASDNFELVRTKISYTTFNSALGNIATAQFNSLYQAPMCNELCEECDSASLLMGRGTMQSGNELNQPNTINGSCADGSSGIFHSDPSIDRIRIHTTNGLPLKSGESATIAVTVWAGAVPASEYLDVYYATDIDNPTWTFVATLQPSFTGTNTLSTSYVLPGGQIQAIRAQYRNTGTASDCAIGDAIDHDDLIFRVHSGEVWSCIADSSGIDCICDNATGSDTLEPTDSNFVWETPTQAEAASDGQIFPSSDCQIMVEVWDKRGNVSNDTSDDFFIIQPTTSSVKTLILWHSTRIETAFGQADRESLFRSLVELAEHANVSGKILDLAALDQTNYQNWDGAVTNQDLANLVARQIRDLIVATANNYPYVRNIILVGNDRQIPFFRMNNAYSYYSEAHYLDADQGDLNPNNSIGSALQANKILTDNYYTELEPEDTQLARVAYLNDLSVGRLLEKPDQMSNLITQYLSNDGQVTVLGVNDRVLVTGHGVLYDSAFDIKELFSAIYSLPTDCLLDDPARTENISYCDDNEYDADLLRNTVFTSPPHKINNINTHANHFAWEASNGGILSTDSMSDDPNALNGIILYSPGCHSGLSVEPSESHPLDLPELMAEKGVLAFIGNTGYGLGEINSSDYTEKLVENLTEELVNSGSITIGRAFANAKRTYYHSQIRYDEVDEKVLHQITLFGIPNTVVVTSTGKKSGLGKKKLPGPNGPDKECSDGICIQRELTTSANKATPPGVTALTLNFEWGTPPACEQTEGPYEIVTTPEGNYFTLNGLSSSECGDAIQPMFIYDSYLSGTIARGIVFLGGPYCTIAGFDPVIAHPYNPSGGGSASAPLLPLKSGYTPSLKYSLDASGGAQKGIIQFGRLTLVTRTGYGYEENSQYFEHLFHSMEFVIYYKQDETDTEEPVINSSIIPPTGFHQEPLTSMKANFSVPVFDSGSGVFRVLVTYNDRTPDVGLQADGGWHSLDLVYNAASQVWEGSLDLKGNLHYYIQAVDNSGNVSVLSLTGADVDLNSTPYGTTWSGPAIFEITYADSDEGIGDGLPDVWEDEFPCLNSELIDSDSNGIDDGDDDPDYDHLITRDEIVYHTNPCLADTDGGGENDGSEINNSHNRNPLVSNDDKTLSIQLVKEGTSVKIQWPDALGENDTQNGYYFVYKSNSLYFNPADRINVMPINHCSPRPECTSDGLFENDHEFVFNDSDTLSFYKVWNSELTTLAPQIDAIIPAEGTAGQKILIYGQNFVENATIDFCNTPATIFSVESENLIRVTVPSGPAGECTITVINPNQQIGFKENGFTYL